MFQTGACSAPVKVNAPLWLGTASMVLVRSVMAFCAVSAASWAALAAAMAVSASSNAFRAAASAVSALPSAACAASRASLAIRRASATAAARSGWAFSSVLWASISPARAASSSGLMVSLKYSSTSSAVIHAPAG